MFFSIIIPVYNVEKYLDECIQSVVKQITSLSVECEVLLIDDGSTDSSGEICDKYNILFPEIINVFHNKNQGLWLTRRFGYIHSTGEYIINCDSDDKLEEGALEKLSNTIGIYNKPDVVLFNYYLYYEKSKYSAYKDIFTISTSCKVTKEDVLKEFLTSHSIVSVCGKCYKRKCIKAYDSFSEYAWISNGEDSLQTLEIFDNAETFVYLNKCLYNYRVGSGMTQRYDCNYYLSFKEIIEQIESRKEEWKLCQYDILVAAKFLSITGRAITQCRLKKWGTFKEQRQYLKTIREDDMFTEKIRFLSKSRQYLQKDHLLLLILLKKKCYALEIILLRAKNLSENLLKTGFKRL